MHAYSHVTCYRLSRMPLETTDVEREKIARIQIRSRKWKILYKKRDNKKKNYVTS